MNIGRDALGIMIHEGLYYEGENYLNLWTNYMSMVAESGDDYDTVMASCKKYEVMPRYPKEMVISILVNK